MKPQYLNAIGMGTLCALALGCGDDGAASQYPWDKDRTNVIGIDGKVHALEAPEGSECLDLSDVDAEDADEAEDEDDDELDSDGKKAADELESEDDEGESCEQPQDECGGRAFDVVV